MTKQQKLAAILGRAGIPARNIECYGLQIVVTCASLQAADKWANLLSTFAKVRGVVNSYDYAAKNTNTVMRPSMVPVVRVFAKIQEVGA